MKKLIALFLFAGALVANSFAGYTYIQVVNRPLNSVFQVDNVGGNDIVNLCYNITISTTVSLAGGQTGTVFLEQSPDGSTGWTEIGRISNSSTGSVVIGVGITDAKTLTLYGVVWPSYYVRIRTANTLGSPSFAMVIGQEMGHD